MIKVKPTKVDLMFESKDGAYFLFDIKLQNQMLVDLKNLNAHYLNGLL